MYGNQVQQGGSMSIIPNRFFDRLEKTLTGGGIIRTYGDNTFSWSDRFITLPNSRGPGELSSSGYYDIYQPAAGTVVTGFEGAATRSFTAKGVILNPREGLFYEIPLVNSANTTLPGNFRITTYTADFTIPDNRISIATKNGDTTSEQVIKLGNGDSIRSAIGLDAQDWNGTVEGYQIDKLTNQKYNVLSGGGTKTRNNPVFNWTERFITLTAGSQFLCASGYFDIIKPPAGTVALVANNTTTRGTRLFTAAGIQINDRESLYYILPISGGAGTINSSFRIVSYTSNARVPSHWILIASRNSDSNTLILGTKQILTNGVALTNQSPYGNGSVLSNVLPQADGLNDTRAGAIGTSGASSREDHIHPVNRLANVTLPPFLLGGGFTLSSQSIYRTYTTEETLEYQVQIVINPPSTGPRKTIVAPNIPGYTLAKFEYNGLYIGTGTAYPGADFMYLGTLYFSPQLPNQLHYVDVSLTYILN